MSQLNADCLNDIFQCLENDKITLHSCLLVNRLWCKISVRILWTSVWNYNTLIACLPKESKEIFYKNGIFTPTSKPPLFNYVEFIKNLEIDNIIKNILHYRISLNYKKYIVAQEIYKLFNQISSLRELHFYSLTIRSIPNKTSTLYLGTGDCLKHLSKLSCRSDIYPGFYHQLSQICHNIQSLKIRFEKVITNGLAELISAQKNLKYLEMSQRGNGEDLTFIISSLTKHPNTLIKLDLEKLNIPLSFIAEFTNLQELVLLFYYYFSFKDFKTLQYVTFPQLQILKFICKCPKSDLLVKFLENNGKNLKEFYVDYVYEEDYDNNLLNLAIAKNCPNLRKLYVTFNNDELETLKIILNNCQYLESIKVWCDDMYLSTKELFGALAKYSPKYFHELQLYPNLLLKKDLEEFFINWKNHIPLSFIVVMDISLEGDDEIMEVIKKYKKLGIIKRFETLTHDDE